jgi:hypothetical protein
MPCLPVETGLLYNNHMDLCVRADSPCLDPSGGTLRQGPAEGSHGLPSSTSAHQFHSDEPRPGTILFGSSLCGDLPQEGRAGTEVGMFSGFLLRAHVLRRPVTRGGTHLQEKSADSRSNAKVSPGLEEGDGATEERGTRHLPESLSEECQNSVSARRTAPEYTDGRRQCMGSLLRVPFAPRLLRAEERLRCVRSTNPSGFSTLPSSMRGDIVSAVLPSPFAAVSPSTSSPPLSSVHHLP